jgi:hypothetical protein
MEPRASSNELRCIVFRFSGMPTHLAACRVGLNFRIMFLMLRVVLEGVFLDLALSPWLDLHLAACRIFNPIHATVCLVLGYVHSRVFHLLSLGRLLNLHLAACRATTTSMPRPSITNVVYGDAQNFSLVYRWISQRVTS